AYDVVCSIHLLGASPFLAHTLEERIAEDAVRLSRSVEIPDTCIKDLRFGDTSRNRGLANALDHRGERLPREAVDQVRPTRIYIHHPRGDMDRVEARLDHQWVELSADQCVAASLPLQLHLALDRRLGGGAGGVEVGRSVIAV